MTLSVAIVGAGPSGCYLAQALCKTVEGVEVDMIDRLAAPYGLVRYGVAPDHQGTKGVIRQFARLFEQQGVGFFGNVSIGVDISLDELRALYDVVVLATGLSSDQPLGIEGEELAGVMRAGTLTRWWNDHPMSDAPPTGIGSKVVIMGHGNVAIDIVRLLAKTHAEFEGSDLGAHHAETLIGSGVSAIEIIGRSPAIRAKFDPVMVKELGKLADVRIRVVGADGEAEDKDAQKRLDALATIDGIGDAHASKEITFRFGWTPSALAGENGKLTQAHFRQTEGDGELALPCDSFVTAIGFADDRALERDALLSRAESIEGGCVEVGLYLCGWFRRGPRGTIPENRADAMAVAKYIAADMEAGRLKPGKPGRAALAARLPQAVDYEGWQRIDAAEMAAAPENRSRQKITRHDDMLNVARGKKE